MRRDSILMTDKLSPGTVRYMRYAFARRRSNNELRGGSWRDPKSGGRHLDVRRPCEGKHQTRRVKNRGTKTESAVRCSRGACKTSLASVRFARGYPQISDRPRLEE